MILVICSTLAVALAFGLTFYYALIANQSAIASQIPGLESVVAKMKGLLVMNTLVFVAIIIVSLFALTSIVTSRIFHPLAMLHRSLTDIASGTLPQSIESSGAGEFGGLEEAMRTAITVIRDRERAELETLAKGRESLARTSEPESAREAIEKVIASKSAYLGIKGREAARAKDDLAEDSLFIKPR
jgi:methyl-accepting chemotaxis protein